MKKIIQLSIPLKQCYGISKTFVLINTLITILCGYGQTSNGSIILDSLHRELRNPAIDDTTKTILMFEIGMQSRIYRPTYWDSIIDVAKNGLYKKPDTLAEKQLLKCISSCFGNLGFIYNKKGEIQQSLKYHFRGLKLDEKIGNVKGIASSYNNIGQLYYNLRNHFKAIEFFEKGLKLREQLNDERGVSQSLINIGLSYQREKKLMVAYKYFKRSLEISKKINNKQAQFHGLCNIGQVYVQLDSIEKGMTYYDQALALKEFVKDKMEIVQVNHLIGNAHYLDGNLSEAERFNKKCYDLAKEIGSPYYMEWGALSLSKIYEAQGKGMKALKMFKVNVKMRDSTNNQRNQKALFEKEAEYKVEKKDQELKLLVKEKELQEAQLEQAKTARNLFIVGFSLSLILIIVIFLSYRQKQKSNRLIQSKNEDIKKQQDILKGQELERKRIAKELHDGLGGSLAAIKMDLSEIKDSSSKKINDVILNMDDAYNEVRNISHDLMPLDLESGNLTFAIQSFIDKFESNKLLNIEFNYFQKEELNNLEYEIQLNIYRIVQELVNNVVKHAKANRIIIAISIQEDQLNLVVEDDGKGFNVEQSAKGIGLKNIDSRVRLLGGTLEIDSKKERGSVFHIQIDTNTERNWLSVA